MLRIVAVVAMVVAPALVVAQDKDKAPKTSYIGVMVGKGKDGAVVVLSTLDNGPAKKAGLKGGDVILRIAGTKPMDLATAVQIIRSLKAGKKAKFEIKRDGKDMTIEVTPVEASS